MIDIKRKDTMIGWIITGCIGLYILERIHKDKRDQSEIRALIADRMAKDREKIAKQQKCTHPNLYSEQGKFKSVKCDACGIYAWMLAQSKKNGGSII